MAGGERPFAFGNRAFVFGNQVHAKFLVLLLFGGRLSAGAIAGGLDFLLPVTRFFGDGS
jgi:hypothetical protein